MAEQLRWSANAEPMGSLLFLARRRHGPVALATAARLSPAASLDGCDAPAGRAVPRHFRRQHKAHVGATPAIYLLLGVGVWEVFRLLKERFFGEHGTRAGIVVGSVFGIAAADARDHHAPNLLYPVGGCPRGACATILRR